MLLRPIQHLVLCVHLPRSIHPTCQLTNPLDYCGRETCVLKPPTSPLPILVPAPLPHSTAESSNAALLKIGAYQPLGSVKQAHMAAGAIHVTADRSEAVSFTFPYYSLGDPTACPRAGLHLPLRLCQLLENSQRFQHVYVEF